MTHAYYNEHDEFAADWLRNLIKAGLIADGEVDTRSIVDVRPSDLHGFGQCHFFAGIGGWSYALRRAGWADSSPVWTGSCPCQPFSLAGAQRGFDDERHLWPVWRELIRQCGPAVVFGEQVASAGKWPGNLQRMRDREVIERVLRGQKFSVSVALDLQGLLERFGNGEEVQAGSQGENCQIPFGLSSEQSGESFDEPSEGESEAEERCLRFGTTSRLAPIDHPRGGMRANGHSVQSGRREDVGQPVAGPDRPDERLSDRQRESGSLLCERDGEHMGSEQDTGDRGRDQGAEDIGIGSATISFGSSTEEEPNWLGLVRGDLEEMGRAVGAMPVQAASAGADHLRDRYWFVADADDTGSQGRRVLSERAGEWLAGPDGLADADSEPRRLEQQQQSSGATRARHQSGGRSAGHDMADSEIFPDARERLRAEPRRLDHTDIERGDGGGELSWVIGADGKSRRVKSGLCLLVDGVPNRVGLLRGFGNAIDPRPAAAFIEAYMTASHSPQETETP